MAEIREEPLSFLDEYASVSIAFSVESVLEIPLSEDALDGLPLRERAQRPAVVKDYDAVPGNHPRDWAWRSDLPHWGLFSARANGASVGCAAVFPENPEVAVLWDLRVAPDARHTGVGSQLFAAVEEWAVTRKHRGLKVETQNINVPACRFYASRGCTLAGIDRYAYPELPDEVRLTWYKALA